MTGSFMVLVAGSVLVLRIILPSLNDAKSGKTTIFNVLHPFRVKLSHLNVINLGVGTYRALATKFLYMIKIFLTSQRAPKG
jgi:hypothetical protein